MEFMTEHPILYLIITFVGAYIGVWLYNVLFGR